MQTNGNTQLEKVRSLLLMMMYLVQEAEEIKLERTKDLLQGEINQILKDYNLSKDMLIPESKE